MITYFSLIYVTIVDVEPNIVTTDDLFNRVRIKNEYRNKLYKFINDEFEK